MRKKVLMLLLASSAAFMLSAGVSSAEGTTNNGMQGYGTSDNRTIGTNNYRMTSDGYRANAANYNNNYNWGWVGLLGLIGLVGLRGKNRERS